jgi:hypothetical protein
MHFPAVLRIRIRDSVFLAPWIPEPGKGIQDRKKSESGINPEQKKIRIRDKSGTGINIPYHIS